MVSGRCTMYLQSLSLIHIYNPPLIPGCEKNVYLLQHCSSWRQVICPDHSHFPQRLWPGHCQSFRLFPEKEVTFSSDDQPWIDSRIKTEIRKRKRIYSKQRRSPQWAAQNEIVVRLLKSAKRNFYKKTN